MPKTVAAEAAQETENHLDQVVEELVEKKLKKREVDPWDLFTRIGLLPARVKCDGYKGEHPSDMSCHTTIIPTTENVLRHINPAHGGGPMGSWWRIKFKATGTPRKVQSPLWAGLKEAGVIINDFYCPHCRNQVAFDKRSIFYHLNPHPGANRVNLDPQVLCLTLGGEPLIQIDPSDDLYESEVE